MSSPGSVELAVRPAAYYTGIFPRQKIQEMVRDREIYGTGILSEIAEDQIQPASIDLRLGDFAYPVDASFLPGKSVGVLDKMRQLDEQYDNWKIDLRNGAVLEKGRLYVIPLMESIKLRSEVGAFANPKSSTGRLDILTRLIADGATVFDQVEEGYSGALLSQLRFRRARGETARAITAAEWKALLSTGQISNASDSGDKTGMLPFSIDLNGAGRKDSLIGWRAKKHTGRIDLDLRDYDPLNYWDPIFFRRATLILDPDEFYILMTKEAIAVPPDFAAEMVPYDTRAGEFRVHYAGFFDPGFGWDRESRKAGSSRGVLEVRSHEVPFLLEHGQTVGWLRYERMAERPDLLYGQDIASHYQGQELKLAKQFRSLPPEPLRY
jgi:dCTP deaminase